MHTLFSLEFKVILWYYFLKYKEVICFTFNYIIKQEDLNYGNHVGNERALLFFQWAREEFLRANNLSETDIGDGSGFIQTEATVQYKKQLFLNQEIKS